MTSHLIDPASVEFYDWLSKDLLSIAYESGTLPGKTDTKGKLMLIPEGLATNKIIIHIHNM